LVFSSGTEEQPLSVAKITNYSIDDKSAIVSEKRPVSILQWAPNGKFLATAFDKLTLWSLE